MKKIIILILFPIIGFSQTVIKCVEGDCDNGEGIKNYQDRIYEGSFKNSKADGYGYCSWHEGGYYEGNYKDGIQSGEGTRVYKGGDKYTGEWKNGQRDGFGTYIWSDDSKFVGEYKDNKKHGKGIITYPDSYIGTGFQSVDYEKTSKSKTDRIITYIYSGSPAEEAGLLVGDVILSVNKLYYDEWIKADGSKRIGKRHKFLIERKDKKKKDKTKTINIKVRIAKVSKKGSGDLMSYDGEWIANQREGIGTAIYYNEVKKMGVWRDGKFTKSLVVEDRIKEVVEKKINEWQEKGEFEKTVTYQERVKEKNRNIKVKELEEAALQDLKSEFCKSIDFSDIELSKYDPDNETFILKGGRYIPSYYSKYYPLGDLIIPVAFDTARYFKRNFSSFKFENPDCIIDDKDKFILSYVELHAEDQIKSIWNIDSTWNVVDSVWNVDKRRDTYVESPIWSYNLYDAKDYTFTDINYNFSDIVIDEIASDVIVKNSKYSSITLNVGTSDVNKNIPKNKKVNNRYALIIGNEDYQSKQSGLKADQNVEYARNDARIFKEYALKTLGVKEENMYHIEDATSYEMDREITLVLKVLERLGSKAELIVYYAGHGYPDEVTKIPYLIPVNVAAKDLPYAIKLDDFYKKLSATGASRIIVFLDACFTGGGRESGLLASRGITVKPKEGVLSGNLIVFSASSEDQSALPYEDQEHGMFTYYLLKKLQESSGNISMGELADYLTDQVSLKSLKINKKEQDPIINFSTKVIDDWRNWKF